MRRHANLREVVVEKFDSEGTSYSRVYADETKGAVPERFRTRREVIGAIAVGLSGEQLDCAAGTGEITFTVIEWSAIASVAVNDLCARMLARGRANL